MRGYAARVAAVALSNRALQVVLFGLAYFVGAELGHSLAFRGAYGEFATYWPPSGLFISVMLLVRGWARLPFVLAGCAANFVSDVLMRGIPAPVSLGFCLANTTEALVAAWALRRARVFQSTTLTMRDVVGLALVTLGCSSPAAAVIGGATLCLGFGGPFTKGLLEWWVSACVGVFVFLPMWWMVLRRDLLTRHRSRWPLLLESLAALITLVFVADTIFRIGERPVAYLTVPVSIWLALRTDPTAVVLGNVFMSLIAVSHTAEGLGPLGQIFPIELRVIFIQGFNVVSSMSTLALAAVVNERQRALEERVESDERFRDLFENISDLAIVTDPHGFIQYANRSWNQFVRQMASDDAATNLLDSCHPEDREFLHHLLTVLPETEELVGVELRLITRAGEVLEVEGNFSCRNQSGTTNRVRVILRDVTARKTTARQLEQAHRRLEEANRQLQALAATDSLTSLPNRRAFFDRLQQECQAAQRYERPLSVILLDVDHFKSYNDSFGHPAGDDILRTLGWVLKDAVREIDTAGRIGGEEFAIVLPQTNSSAALLVAERIRRAIGEYPWPLRQMTASLGVATMTGLDADPGSLVEAADQALYQAKRSGRNQTVRAATQLAALAR